MTFSPRLMEALHDTSSQHRDLVMASMRCGCFSCLSAFPPAAIKEWTDGEQTALCPLCGMDAVLPNHGNVDVLRPMNAYWFDEQTKQQINQINGEKT